MLFANPAVLQRTEGPRASEGEGDQPVSPHGSPYIGAAVHGARCWEKREFSADRVTFKANVSCVYRTLERTVTTQRGKDVSGNSELV